MVLKELFWLLGAFCGTAALMVANVHAKPAEARTSIDNRVGKSRPKRPDRFYAINRMNTHRYPFRTIVQDKLKTRKAMMEHFQNKESEKRSCFDWWCSDGKATETPPTRLPPGITTTPVTPPPSTTIIEPSTTRIALPPRVQATTLPPWFHGRRKRISRPKRVNYYMYDGFRPKRAYPNRDLINGQNKEILVAHKAFKNSAIEKRSCFDWWCSDGKATETPPTQLPSDISTTPVTPPLSSTMITTPSTARTTLPPSRRELTIQDLEEAWQSFMTVATQLLATARSCRS